MADLQKPDAARDASMAAIHNARIQERLGYDFGYCSPGTIDALKDGRFEVCIP